MTNFTYTIPAAETTLLAQMRSADEQNHRPGDALTDDQQLARARAWLARILVDAGSLMAHTKWLCQTYQITFRPPLPRRLLEGLELDPAGANSQFPNVTQLPEHRVSHILKEGVAGLLPDEIAPVLLNPHALWYLADRIDVELPDYWLSHFTEVGKEMMQQWGIDFQIPGLDAELCKPSNAQEV